MTTYEYVSNITQNGTRIKMPNFAGFELKEYAGDKHNGIAKTYYGSTLSQYEDELKTEKNFAKVTEINLKKITLTALNVTNSEQFYRKCFAYSPVNCRNGAYAPDKEKWDALLLDIVTEIANKLTEKAYTERHMKGAQTMLAMLTNRIDAWQRKITARIDKEEKENEESKSVSVTFNIT